MLQSYLLELDGKLAGRFFDFNGGMAHAEVVKEVGTSPIQHKHISAVTFDAMILVCGPGMSQAFYDWVGGSFGGNLARRAGAVIMLDNSSKPTARLDFREGLVSSLVLPDLDKSKKKDAFLKVSVKPETTSIRKWSEALDLGMYGSAVAKAWHGGSFRIDFDGLKTAFEKVTSIHSLSLGETPVTDNSGAGRNSQIAGSKVEFSDIVLELPSPSADGFYQWHKSFVVEGDNRPDREKSGTIDYLAPGSTTPYFTVTLDGVGITSISRPMGAGDAPVPVTVGMYCDKMTFSAGTAAVN